MACLHKQTNNFKFLKKDYNERRLITKKKKEKKNWSSKFKSTMPRWLYYWFKEEGNTYTSLLNI